MKQYKNNRTGIIYNLISENVFKMQIDNDNNTIIKNEFVLIEDTDDWTMIAVDKKIFDEMFTEVINEAP